MHAEEDRGLTEGRGGIAQFERILAFREVLRGAVAELVQVTPEHVSLTASTTDGCNIVLAGLGLREGDEVITTTDEHFGLLGPLRTSGATVVVAEPEAEHITAAITSRTRLIAVSHVLWTTGAILPVHELRAATGLPVLVDGAQSVGAIPVDANGVDFYTVSGQKWLCGPGGNGSARRGGSGRAARGAAELPLTALARGRRRLRAEGRSRPLRPESHAACAHGRVARGVDDVSRLGFERAAQLAERFRDGLPRRART